MKKTYKISVIIRIAREMKRREFYEALSMYMSDMYMPFQVFERR